MEQQNNTAQELALNLASLADNIDKLVPHLANTDQMSVPRKYEGIKHRLSTCISLINDLEVMHRGGK